MTTCIRKASASVFANVGVYANIEIKLFMEREDGEKATISFGLNDELTLGFWDVDSLERLAAVAADGAKQLQERIAANADAQRRSDQLVEVG